ncbi:GNAT family N-acetyltransferase [Streptomyces sp. NBC_00536]|uniref:GNAT family N-acetyltransferase n=1 Tax=Streptomyces sp. NBC_00536 TaxID=2975769 RepID=UPI002E80C3E0|nr:GNAT family N-acetyltransferase [Streptomyces sp. NBC_00536]WUC79587.1 GNAT family N-acetyltransferase [Streptomyces sp. NBC_00536]
MLTTTTTVRLLPGGVRAVERAADLPGEGWDALAGPYDIFLTRRWLDVVEATAGVPMTYLWTERAGRLVAGLATATATTSVPWALGRPDVVLPNSAEAALPGAAELLAALGDDPSRALMPALVAGGRHVGSTRVLRSPDATTEDVEALVAAAEALAREAGLASVCFLYLDEGDADLAGTLDRRGYLSCTTGRYSTLRVPRDGFDGYLASLPRKRRGSVAAERRRMRESQARVGIESLDTADLARCAELESSLLAKYGIDIRPDQVLAQIRQVRDCFGDDAFAVVAHAEGEVRGFGLILRHGDHWYARQTGYDYAYQERSGLPLYFELLYYRLLEEAAAAGVTTLHYGLGSEQAKRSRGCTATEQRCHLLPLAPKDPVT